MYHTLKTWPHFFQRILEGKKTAEFRKNDRDFRVSDLVVLLEYVPGDADKKYTGRIILAEVTDMVQAESLGIPQGYCVMSIKLKEITHE